MSQPDQWKRSALSNQKSDGDERTMARSQPIERQVILAYAFKTAIGASLSFTILYFFIPIPIPKLPHLIDRLVYTLRLQSFTCLTLIGGIQLVALTRFHTTAIDPINGRGEHHVAVSSRYVSNTVEQFIVNFVGQVILTTFLEEQQMKVIPILVLFFVLGRILFYFGYKQSYLKRAIGFILTFGVSAIIWFVVILCVLSDLISTSKLDI